MSRLKLQQLWIILTAALLSVPCILSGQAYFGTVSGVVTDPAGAVVPKAKVVLTDQEKGFTFTAVTNNEGRFLFSAVPPSDYRLTSDLPGFETAIRTGVRVNVNQNVTANLPLKVAVSASPTSFRRSLSRAGYGLYYSQTRSGANGVGNYGTQGFNQYTNMITTYQSDGATPYLHLSNPYPNGLIQPSGSSLGLLNDIGQGAIGPLHNENHTPYAQTWSLGFERQFSGSVVVDLEYIGKKGTHLYFGGDNQLDILGPEIEHYTPDQISDLSSYVDNPFYGIIIDPNSALSSPQVSAYQLQLPYPQYSYVTTDVPAVANSTYHSLQITADKNYSNGLQFFASFVWSKSIDDSSVDDDNITWLGSFPSLQDPNEPSLSGASPLSISLTSSSSVTNTICLSGAARHSSAICRV